MAYNKRRFAAELIIELEKGHDTERISAWANKIYAEQDSNLDGELREIIQNIRFMNFDNDSGYTESDLRNLAVTLISSTLEK